MKIDKSTRVAVYVGACTLAQKQFVYRYLRGTPEIYLDKTSWISNKGQIPSFAEGVDYYMADECPVITYKEFMKSINPYGEKKVQVQCSNDEEYLQAQEFAFNLGYTWYSKHGAEAVSNTILGLGLKYSMELTHSDKSMSSKYDYVISFDQFMALELPDECQTTPLPFGMVPPGQPHVHKSEPKKYDAYISQEGELYVYLRYACEITTEITANAYKYNLLSEEEFKAKYEKKELKFGHWDVTVFPGHVKVGCKTFTKKSLRNFKNICDTIVTTPPDPGQTDMPSIKDAYDFLTNNFKELGL